MNSTNKKMLRKYFDFLISTYSFEVVEIKSYNYALYAKFVSDYVGIYFSYEFRETVPFIQISLLQANELIMRPGLYTLRELYKNENFELSSFYLDEIIAQKNGSEYRTYFNEIKTLEDGIKISAELVLVHANDFLIADKQSYAEMDNWVRNSVMESKL